VNHLKRVLITGANSYVGTNVEKWLMKEPDKYYVETLDMKDPNWKNFNFSKFDVVLHVAGIAHVSTKKSMKDLYFKVNRDLAIETAQKSKDSGISHFIFMSSMIVYSSHESRITVDTTPNPDNFYGLSKLQAESAILKMQSDKFIVTILRPPMIYGNKSKGNFHKLVKIVRSVHFFPNYINKKSILYINNLSRFLSIIITQECRGVYYPQNPDYTSTLEIIKEYSKTSNYKVYFSRVFNPLIKLLSKKITIVNKLFGDFYYDIDDSQKIGFYQEYNLTTSIVEMEEMHD